jgi:hypothetical protein
LVATGDGEIASLFPRTPRFINGLLKESDANTGNVFPQCPTPHNGLITPVCGFLPAGTADLPFYFTRFLPVNTPRRHKVCPSLLSSTARPDDFDVAGPAAPSKHYAGG